jgi:hypothetical protein
MIAAPACSWTRWVWRNSASCRPAALSAWRNSCSVSAGDAAGPRSHVGFGLLVHVGVGDHVRDGEPPTGPQHPSGLGEHLGLIAREVDHAVGDHHVDAGVGERQLLEIALEELDVLNPGVGGVAAREVEHLVGHVDPDGTASRADPACGDQHIRPGARPKVQDDLAVMQIGDDGRHSAAQRRVHRGVGGVALPTLGIQGGPEHAGLISRTAAARAGPGGHGRDRVLLAHGLAHLLDRRSRTNRPLRCAGGASTALAVALAAARCFF